MRLSGMKIININIMIFDKVVLPDVIWIQIIKYTHFTKHNSFFFLFFSIQYVAQPTVPN